MVRHSTALVGHQRGRDRRGADRDRAAGPDDDLLSRRLPGDDCGSATVEAALAVGSLVAVLALVLAAMGALLMQVRCVDAAAAGARLAARDDHDGARRAAGALVPEGAEVVVDVGAEVVTVRVRAPPLGSALPGLRVGAEAVAVREPGGVEFAPGPTDGVP